MLSPYSGQSIPDSAGEIRVAVDGASPVIDVAYLLEFRKGQRRIDRPEFVDVFINGAIHQELPIPGMCGADVLGMEPDVRSAVAHQLIIPLRVLVELVRAS